MDSEDSDILLVPHDRVGAIIGKAGATKKEIETKTETVITIDSDAGEVEIVRKGHPLGYMKAMRVVKAIARGSSFSSNYSSFLCFYSALIFSEFFLEFN